MDNAKTEFAKRLITALERAGVPPRPAVVKHEFTQRYRAKPIIFHGVRLWLRDETFPSYDKLLCLAAWLGVQPAIQRCGDEIPKAVRERRKRWNEGIGYQEREFFELFLKLPVPQRKVAREVILALARANGVSPLNAAG